MTLERNNFRQTVVDAIKASGIVAPENVFSERVRPTGEEQLPYVLVTLGDERFETRTVTPTSYRVTCELEVESVAQALDGVTEACEAIAGQVRALLANWPALFPDYERFDIERLATGVNVEGGQEVGGCLLTYSAVWDEGAPTLEGAGLSELNTIHVDTDLPDEGDAVDHEQTIEIETNE